MPLPNPPDQQHGGATTPQQGETLTLRPRTTYVWLFLAICCGGMAVGILLLRESVLAGGMVTIIFALFAAGTATQLLPGMMFLKLSPEGFEARNVRQHLAARWCDVESFFIVRRGKYEYVAFRLKQPARQTPADSSRPGKTDCDGLLPFATGFDIAQLAEQMNTCRQRFQ